VVGDVDVNYLTSYKNIIDQGQRVIDLAMTIHEPPQVYVCLEAGQRLALADGSNLSGQPLQT
jgi:hypothetical protein